MATDEKLVNLISKKLAGRHGVYRHCPGREAFEAVGPGGDVLEGSEISGRELDHICATRGKTREQWEAIFWPDGRPQ